VLTMRQGVNEVPSLVFFKRQPTLRTGMQHRTRTPLTTIGSKVNTLCCVAKAEERTEFVLRKRMNRQAAAVQRIRAENDLISGTLPPFG
jgi:hypothetical protein